MKKTAFFFALISGISIFISCKKQEIVENPIITIPEKIYTLMPQNTFQTISGFGGANRMWGTQSLKPAEAAIAFGLEDGQLGLSIFRVRLSSNKNEWPIITEAVKEANKYGVKVLACPWSPPAALKSNNSDIRGYLLPENYKAFKDYMNDFVDYMAQNGAKIDVVSIQNEPDWKPGYESCDYTAEDIVSFLTAPGKVKVSLAAPESLNFNQAMTNAVLQSPDAAKNIDIIAGHIYGGGIAKFPLAETQKKEIWMTEYLLNLDTGNAGAAKWNTYSESAKWGESIKILGTMHDAMSNNWNAYIWWYLQRYYSFIGDGEEGTTNGAVLKRGIAYSHFSKYVRPGFVRFNVDMPVGNYLKVTAYKKGTQTVVVIINPEIFEIKNINLKGLNPKSAEAITTSETFSNKKESLTIKDNQVLLNIPALSVMTVIIEN